MFNLVASVVTLHVQANPFVKIELTIQMRYLPRSLPNNVHSWLTNVQKIFSQQVLEPSTFAQFSTQVARHLFLTSDSSKRAFFTFRKTWSIWSDFCVCLVDLCDFCHSVHLDMAPTHAINVFIIIFGCAFIAKIWCVHATHGLACRVFINIVHYVAMCVRQSKQRNLSKDMSKNHKK